MQVFRQSLITENHNSVITQFENHQIVNLNVVLLGVCFNSCDSQISTYFSLYMTLEATFKLWFSIYRLRIFRRKIVAWKHPDYNRFFVYTCFALYDLILCLLHRIYNKWYNVCVKFLELRWKTSSYDWLLLFIYYT